MRVLFVFPELPHSPFTGAHTRPLTMLKAAARRHEAVAVGSAPPGADLSTLSELCVEVRPVSEAVARPVSRRLLAAGRRVLSPVPLLGRGRSEAVATLVARTIADMRPQALYMETMYAIHYRAAALPTIVDLPDVVSSLCESAAAAHPLRYAAARAQAAAARRSEPALLDGTVPVTINDDDRERLARVGVAAYTVPLAVTPPLDDAVRHQRHAVGEPLRLLFVGSFLHAPNREAARFLVRRLAPALRAAGLPFRLTIAGRAAPAWLRGSTGKGVFVYSDVPDLTPFYRATDVVVAPLAHGGGTKNKTLEAMAWGLPVIGAPQAFTGLTAAEGDTYVCVPLRSADMTAAIHALADDPDRQARMGLAARDYVVSAHAPELSLAKAAVLFDTVADGGGVAEVEARWRVEEAGVELHETAAHRSAADATVPPSSDHVEPAR
jgi:glycosyltransferase involved in cell wall biosynthesis